MSDAVTTVTQAVAKPIKEVLDGLMEAMHAFWLDNQLKTRPAVGATQRLLRVQTRIEVLLERFRAGTLPKWRKRPPRVTRQSAADVGPDAAPQHDAPQDEAPREKPEPGPRKKRYGLPVYYGWLGHKMPQVAVMNGSDLVLSLKSEEMQAHMRHTPEVARISRPVLRMYGLEETALRVPEGYGEFGPPNKRHMAPDPKPVDPDAYVPPFELPEGYVEERDGRRSHPLRDPTWRYWNCEYYREYVYYDLSLKLRVLSARCL
jgi:hypothetical protein